MAAAAVSISQGAVGGADDKVPCSEPSDKLDATRNGDASTDKEENDSINDIAENDNINLLGSESNRDQTKPPASAIGKETNSDKDM